MKIILASELVGILAVYFMIKQVPRNDKNNREKDRKMGLEIAPESIIY